MKKVIAGAITIALTLLSFIGLSFAAIVPASAGDLKENAPYCQAEGNGTWHLIAPSKASIIDKDGNLKQGGINENDIIPPFDYNFGGNDYGTFGGQNWDSEENQALYRNGCKAVSTVVTPVLPTAPVLTCVNPTATLVIPKQPSGINVTSAADDNGNYTVLFELPKNIPTKTYTFPVGFQNPVTIFTIDNRPQDPYWDATKGACNLPDTGLFGLSDEMTYVGGGLLALGILAVIGNAVTRRRNA